MKKLIITAFAFFAFASTSFAQEKKVEFGVKAGANIAFVTTYDPNEYAKPIYAPNFGVFVNYNISEKLSLQLDVLYSQQGIQIDEQPIETNNDVVALRPQLDALPNLTGVALPIDGQGTLSRYYTYDYINLPIVAKYEVVSGLNVMAGAQIGYLFSANKNASNTISDEAKAGLAGNITALNTLVAGVDALVAAGAGDLPQEGFGGATANQMIALGYYEQAKTSAPILEEKANDLLEEGDIDNTDSFNSIDVSLVFGAQYELPSGIFFDARFNLGMTDIKTDEAKIADNQDPDQYYVKNRTVQLGIGYKF